jgi:hypothetical protein
MAVNTSGLEALIRAEAVGICNRLADAFVKEAQGRAPRRGGPGSEHLAESIKHTNAVPSGSGATAHVEVGASYAQYNDEGVGVYGPKGTRIQGRPLLAFDWPAAGGTVIVRSVAGYPGSHFWTQTVRNWPSIVARVS